jgi:hypothetical protein
MKVREEARMSASLKNRVFRTFLNNSMLTYLELEPYS